MKVNILSNKISWFGKYSGYECLPDYFAKNIDATINIAKYNLYNKIVGKYYKIQNNWNYRSEDILNEIRFCSEVLNADVSHILYLENHLHLLDKLKKPEKKLFGTVHLPISQWGSDKLQKLSTLENLILLYEEEANEFSKYIHPSKIRIIKHGVDIDFFKPGNPAAVIKSKVLFVGHFLRNFDMTLKVYLAICKDVSSEIQFHFIIPSSFRNTPVLQKLAQNPNVFFHEKLSDEELLEQYQTSYILVMPMSDSGANTAIIQALSVGLPIVTTDVGGIRSYGGGGVFPVIENNNVEGMCSLINRYLFDLEFRNKIAEAERVFSEEYLDWNLISRQHVEFYKQSLLTLA